MVPLFSSFRFGRRGELECPCLSVSDNSLVNASKKSLVLPGSGIPFLEGRLIFTIMSFYTDFRYEKHVFIYAVCGRASSTALQRILNSSNEICIWGESWSAADIFLEFIHDIKQKNADIAKTKKNAEFKLFKDCFQTGVHDKFYPNAFRPLNPLIAQAEALFGEAIKPLQGFKRTGYKEIRIRRESTLHTLIEMFPNSMIVFLFRDPLKQWVSVRDTGWFAASKDINKFIEEYNKRATIYMNIAQKLPQNCIFIENTQLSDPVQVEALLRQLDISKYDKSLLEKVVSSVRKLPLTDHEKKLLEEHVIPTYRQLKNLVFSPASNKPAGTERL